MAMFAITEKSISTKVGKTTTFEFPYEPGNIITKMTTPCDCSTVYDIKDKNLVRIVYEAKKVPQYLKQSGHTSYNTVKQFDITYTAPDGIEHVAKLNIKAFIQE